MKTTVQLKYNKGDVVSVKHWSDIPEAENRYVIDGYSIRLVPGADPKILYVFHCSCNKYIGYHEQITEDRLTALEENHPHEVEIDAKDVFGNDINFGDQVYYHLYHKYNGKIGVSANTLSVISGGNVEEIICSNNTGESFNSNCISVKYKRNILHTKPNGSEWLDGRRFGTESREPINSICKTVPETFYKDIVDTAYNLYAYLNDKYDSYTFKCLMEIFGQYDKAKEYLEKIIEKKEAAKKKDSKLDNIAKDINELSDAERQELIDMLMNSK